MSKKKQRYNHRKYRKNKSCDCYAMDRHHIFFQRRHYSGSLLKLRLFPYCIVEVPRNTLHRRIHEYIGDIPCPSGETAEYVVKVLREKLDGGEISMDDRIDKRLKILISIMQDVEFQTVEALYKQLAIVKDFYGPS